MIMKECDGSPTWDLSEQFYIQSDFFSLLDKISCLPDPNHDSINKFKSAFPEGTISDLKFRLLKYDMELYQIKVSGALGEIARKMTNAGTSLSFNI